MEQPPRIVTAFGTSSWHVRFQDESREIASEYQGGVQNYRVYDRQAESLRASMAIDSAIAFDLVPSEAATVAMIQQQPLPPIQGMIPDSYQGDSQHVSMDPVFDVQSKAEHGHYQSMSQMPRSGSTQHSRYNDPGTGNSTLQGSVASYRTTDSEVDDPDGEKKEYLDSPEETLFMQVFVEEVGLWMDSMDPQKHFSRLLPFHSLSEPMLLNAFLACGARHLTLVNPAYTEEKALHYYDTATRYLLKNLQNPNRDTVICATTAVILNIYEIMSERALQRMNHIAGARALIKECGWNARAHGIGAACFWLNVGLEVLSCLHFNWQIAWDPDEWGVDMNLSREMNNGREESWTHRMLYIIAKVCNFRATIPRQPEANARDEQVRMQQRHEEWMRLRHWCDAWNDGVPRTMQPMAVTPRHVTNSKSVFPEVWLIKRSTIVARLFYHTAMLLLAQVHPYYGVEMAEMAELRTRHTQMICSIVAHVKDRGVASVAIRSLAHAAEHLTERVEQEEVLKIFEKINKETGWRIGYVYKELMEKWGWDEKPSAQQFAQTHTAAQQARDAQQRQREQQLQQRQQQQRSQSIQLVPGFDFAQQQQQQQHQQQQQQQGTSQHSTPMQSQSSPMQAPSLQATPQLPLPPSSSQSQKTQRPPTGIPNPMYKTADFNLPQHPYQNYYVPASTNGYVNGGLGDSGIGGNGGGSGGVAQQLYYPG